MTGLLLPSLGRKDLSLFLLDRVHLGVELVLQDLTSSACFFQELIVLQLANSSQLLGLE
jgi:hypothetical protein